MAFDGYVRVSSTRGRGGDSFISPDQQRKAIQAYATAHGLTIGAWHEDLDISGGKTQRPGLDLAMSRCESGLSEGIIVAKMDRFARSLLGALELLKRLDKAGAEFVSVGEKLDSRGPAGKMMQRLMLVFAEFELDRIKDTWRNSQEAAVARGIHISSTVPVGYTRNSARILEIDPKAAKHVRRAFELAADGVHWKDIGAMLRDAGLEGAYGNKYWETRAVRLLVNNPVYTGEARCGDFKNPTAHEPIVDRALFERASRSRRVMSPRRDSTALLAGLIRCAGCQHVMKADKMTVKHGVRAGQRSRIYRCRIEYAAGRCKEPASIAGWVVEPWVVDQFNERAGDLLPAAGEASADLDELRATLDTKIRELDFYRDAPIQDVLDAEQYADGLRFRQQAVNEAIEQLALAQQSSGGVPLDGSGIAWADLDVSDQRELLSAAFDAVFIKRGRLPIGERAVIVEHGDLPSTVPKRGRRMPLRRFDWPDSPR
jgi:DNA invertase Pin-like site-specific DNA recombinase